VSPIVLWNPNRISESGLDFYLVNCRRFWPYHLHERFLEEEALHFLALKHYQVEYALISVIFKVDELLELIRCKQPKKLGMKGEVDCNERVTDIEKLMLEEDNQTVNLKANDKKHINTGMNISNCKVPDKEASFGYM